MNAFVLFFLRLLTMAFGFFLACMATGASLLLLTGIIAPEEVRVAGENDTYTALLIGIFAIASIDAYASALPGQGLKGIRLIFAGMPFRSCTSALASASESLTPFSITYSKVMRRAFERPG